MEKRLKNGCMKHPNAHGKATLESLLPPESNSDSACALDTLRIWPELAIAQILQGRIGGIRPKLDSMSILMSESVAESMSESTPKSQV
jgi:hypothetical protein